MKKCFKDGGQSKQNPPPNFTLILFAINPLYTRNPAIGTSATSEDPDEMAQNVEFHQGLHCLLR